MYGYARKGLSTKTVRAIIIYIVIQIFGSFIRTCNTLLTRDIKSDANNQEKTGSKVVSGMQQM